jgi:hypothetical protein
MCVMCEVSKNLESLEEHTFECAKTKGVQPEVLEDLVKKRVEKRPLSIMQAMLAKSFVLFCPNK